jgi:hypothetical protein
MRERREYLYPDHDTPSTYIEFATVNASDPSKASFIKVRKGFVDSAPFTFPYSQGGSYPNGTGFS